MSGRPHGGDQPLVVSLTSYPPRFEALALTIKALMRQTLKPDALVLWIDRESVRTLPSSVRTLERHGLSILPCDDVGPFSKIVHTLEAYPEATAVTADDDCYYPPRWLEGLVAASAGAPGRIVCYSARRMLSDGSGGLAPYGEWPLHRGGESDMLLPRGTAGVLYPPGSLHPDVMDLDAYRRFSPRADDLWLKWMSARAGTRVLVAPDAPDRWSWPGTQRQTLANVNVTHGGNDRQIRNLVEAYGLPFPL